MAFARGFFALGALVGELRRFGGMIACVPQQSAAFPAAVLSLGLRGLMRGCGFAVFPAVNHCCLRGLLMLRQTTCSVRYQLASLLQYHLFARARMR